MDEPIEHNAEDTEQQPPATPGDAAEPDADALGSTAQPEDPIEQLTIEVGSPRAARTPLAEQSSAPSPFDLTEDTDGADDPSEDAESLDSEGETDVAEPAEEAEPDPEPTSEDEAPSPSGAEPTADAAEPEAIEPDSEVTDSDPQDDTEPASDSDDSAEAESESKIAPETASGFEDATARDISFADMQMPDELRPHETLPLEPLPGSEVFPPGLERERPERPPLVPRIVWIVIASIAGVLVLALAGWFAFQQMSRVEVPGVTGISLAAAETRLQQVGLSAEVTEQRFGSEPKGQVIEQTPAPGTQAREGDIVKLVISAGTEEFAMPDVVGSGLELARGQLESRGLVVAVEVTVSDAASNTVLSSLPAAGAVVRSGDVVRLTVAAPRSADATLQPFLMSGVAVVLDPAPPAAEGAPDTSMEVARRLRALLEASGASVVMLRSGSDTSTTDADRAARARASTSTVAIGLSVDASGTAGRIVYTQPAGTDASGSSARIASTITSALALAVPPATTAPFTSEKVLTNVTSPWLRVRLGSLAAPADKSALADPAWQDTVARTLYTALGGLFGTKETL